MAKIPVLNWYAKNQKMARGLRKLFEKLRPGFSKEFSTMRLGDKWADRLNPGRRVAISISDNPRSPHIVGHACVIGVEKKWFCDVTDRDLRKNIGAKQWEEAYKDMGTVYGHKKFGMHSIVSAIRLVAVDH